MAQLDTGFALNCPVEDAFRFMVETKNFELCTPPDAGLKLVDAPEVLALGSRFRFELRAFGQSRESEHEVVEFNENTSFVEMQVKGPVKRWRHTHLFESTGENSCRIRDIVEFEPPGGLVGLLVSEKMIRSQLHDGFEYRHTQMKRLLES